MRPCTGVTIAVTSARLSARPAAVLSSSSSFQNRSTAPVAVGVTVSCPALRKNGQNVRSIRSSAGSMSAMTSRRPSAAITKMSAPAPPASVSPPAPSSRMSRPAPPVVTPATGAGPRPASGTDSAVTPVSAADTATTCSAPSTTIARRSDTLAIPRSARSATVARWTSRPPGTRANSVIPSSAPAAMTKTQSPCATTSSAVTPWNRVPSVSST